jgi:cell division protein ZapA
MNNKLSIKINIAERFYSLKVEPDEEEKIRLAAKIISDKILSLKERQSGKDAQDWLAMACLWFAMKVIDAENNPDLSIAIKGIQNFERQIAEYLEYAAENNKC